MRSDVNLLYKFYPNTFRQKTAFSIYRLLVRLDVLKGHSTIILKFGSSVQGYTGKHTLFWCTDGDFQAVGALIVGNYRILVEKETAKSDWTLSIGSMKKGKTETIKQLFDSKQPNKL